MDKVYALSYNAFNDMVRERDINDDNVKDWNQAFIEVQGEEDIKNDELAFHFKQNHPNVIRLTFDDVDEDEEVIDLSGITKGLWVRTISKEQATTLHEFIHRNKEKNFLIHCHAGISRSGAIAQYVCEVKDIPLEIFQQMNPYTHPNRRVLTELRQLNK